MAKSSIITAVILTLIISCKKSQKVTLPVLTTTVPNNITLTGVSSGGNITSNGGGQIYSRGVCWSTANNPTYSLPTKTIDGAGTGSFTSTLGGLSGGTTYYIRAYANNEAGFAYGNEITFTMPLTTGQYRDGG